MRKTEKGRKGRIIGTLNKEQAGLESYLTRQASTLLVLNSFYFASLKRLNQACVHFAGPHYQYFAFQVY